MVTVGRTLRACACPVPNSQLLLPHSRPIQRVKEQHHVLCKNKGFQAVRAVSSHAALWQTSQK